MAEAGQVEFFYAEDLDSPALRLKHLEELKKYSIDIKVKTEGSDRTGFTKLKEISRTGKEEFIVTEEVTPKDMLEKIVQNQISTFEYSDSQGKFQFKTRFLGQAPGSMRFSIPDTIERIRGRAYYRVRPNPKEPIEVVIDIPGKGLFKGQLMDISEGGLAAYFSLPSSETIKPPIEAQLLMSLPKKPLEKPENWYKVRTASLIKFVGLWEGSKYKVGIEYRGLPEQDKKAIVNYILMRQREEIRKVKEFE